MEKRKKHKKLSTIAGCLIVVTALTVYALRWCQEAYPKHQTAKMIETVSLLADNIHNAYRDNRNYADLTTGEAIRKKVFPEAVLYADTSPHHLQKGRIEIFADSLAKKSDDLNSFVIRFHGLTSQMCVDLASENWTDKSSSGVVAMEVRATPDVHALNTEHLHRYCDGSAVNLSAGEDKGYVVACKLGKIQSLPLDRLQAEKACNCTGKTCMITWKYE